MKTKSKNYFVNTYEVNYRESTHNTVTAISSESFDNKDTAKQTLFKLKSLMDPKYSIQLQEFNCLTS